MKFNIDMKYLHISCLNCRACFPEMVPARYVITPNNTQSKGISNIHGQYQGCLSIDDSQNNSNLHFIA